MKKLVVAGLALVSAGITFAQDPGCLINPVCRAQMERQKNLEEYRNSPEYQAMEQWKKEYMAWRENIIKQMQEAYNAGDFQKLHELKMKLVRNEGAPPRPQRTEQDKQQRGPGFPR
jgi:hypothetical protein